MAVTDRADAERLDRDDPLADLRDRFVVDDPDLLYLDGNSLGRLPRRSIERLRTVVEREWGGRLIRSWNERWMDLPMRAGDRIGEHLVGAAPGQVAVSDSTSVNLYKLAVAALDARPGRETIVSDRHNFPSDRYVLEGLAAARGRRLELVEFDELGGPTAAAVERAVDERTALLSLSQVDYRSGALADMAAINAAAHRAGALTLWDLCHSVGAVPVELDSSGTDLAVGCTYKYLNAGPGAPAFLYVRREHQASMRQPIWGWFGQRDQFAMAQGYEPAPNLSRFLVGTPFVPGIALVEEGVALLAEAGIERLRAKGIALTELAIELHDAWLAPLGFTLASPRDPARRGAHVSLAHPDGYRICQALISKARVIPDFRPPDRIRIGPAPLTTRFVDVWDAMERLRRLVAGGLHLDVEGPRARVT
ncbi:MAG TPA: kynureninase [Actinomycetes bacterium]|jgi:kynureninase|nr:kynureninase [Actinomycetes bacterium]